MSDEGQVQTPSTENMMNDVQVETSFLDTLPEDLRGDDSLKSFKNVEGLAKSYVSAQQMLGKSIRMPTEEAGTDSFNEFYGKLESIPGVARIPTDPEDAEAYGKFFNKIGRPETPDGYEFDVPDELINSDYAKELKSNFSQFAHKLGLTKQQAKDVVNFEFGLAQQNQTQFQEQQEQYVQNATQMLKEQWGPDFDNRLSGAKNVLNHYEQKYGDYVKELRTGPAQNNPALVAMLAELGGMLTERGTLGATTTAKYGISSEEAQQRISDIRGNRDHPVNVANHPEREQAMAKLQKLYEIAYNEQSN